MGTLIGRARGNRVTFLPVSSNTIFMDIPDREDAPEIMYIVFDLDNRPVDSFADEDEAYAFEDHDERVVTYKKV